MLTVAALLCRTFTVGRAILDCSGAIAADNQAAGSRAAVLTVNRQHRHLRAQRLFRGVAKANVSGLFLLEPIYDCLSVTA